MRSMDAHLTDQSVDVDPFPLPPEVADGSAGPQEAADGPDGPLPGMGLVWVTAVPGGGFRGSWQGNPGSASIDTPDLELVLAWARSVPAEGIMLSMLEDEDWRLLEE